jgi:hypothetical protein
MTHLLNIVPIPMAMSIRGNSVTKLTKTQAPGDRAIHSSLIGEIGLSRPFRGHLQQARPASHPRSNGSPSWVRRGLRAAGAISSGASPPD